MQIVFYVLAAVVMLIFGSFAIASHQENEHRAASISWLMAVIGAGIMIGIAQLSDDVMRLVLTLLGILLVVAFLLILLPIGKVNSGRDIPSKRFDERDIMFARARLVPGSLNYAAYYHMRPENQKIDDKTRAKPGLLSPESKLANEYLFVAPEASFTLTEVMGDMVEGEPVERKLTLPIREMTEYVKGLAIFFGALDVGIAELHPYHVYSNIGRGPGVYGEQISLEHGFAVAFTVEMSHEMVAANPNPPGAMETAKQYVEAGVVALQLAEAVRRMGYQARAHIDGNYRVIAPLVARDAGLGEIGRMSLLMTPKQGPRVRIGVVTTDLPLLVEERGTDTAVIDFCTICKKCAENCPTKSIPFDERKEIDGALRWRINPESCFMYWNVIGTDCGICMTVCPYSHPDSLHHNLLRWGIQWSGAVRRGALWLDDLFYGRKPAPKEGPRWTRVT